MRKLIFVAFVFLGLKGCKTSERVIPVEKITTTILSPSNKKIHYKDVNGVFEKYIYNAFFELDSNDSNDNRTTLSK